MSPSPRFPNVSSLLNGGTSVKTKKLTPVCYHELNYRFDSDEIILSLY